MATIRIELKKKPLQNGSYPLFLRVTQDRKHKRISLGLSCGLDQWDKKREVFRRNAENYKKRNLILAEVKSRAMHILDDFSASGKPFSLKQFEEKFRATARSRRMTVKDFWGEVIDDFRKSGKEGNAKVYEETMKSFFQFLKNDDIPFSEITPGLLYKYEVYLRERNGTEGGISVRMRTIRALFNRAIRDKLVAKEFYPFNEYKISKLKARDGKIAISREEVRKVEELDLEEYPHLIHARHFFVFSYYTQGMNLVDVMKLKWENIVNGRIDYIRSKTGVRQMPIILPPVQNIIDYYSETYPETDYIFPFTRREGLTEKQFFNRKKKVLGQINRGLKEIGQIIGASRTLSTYVTRHSFATNLKNAGVATQVISESLGHSSVKITETYLKSFEAEVIDEAVKNNMHYYPKT